MASEVVTCSNAVDVSVRSGGPPSVYWSDEDVLCGKMIYMPTGRIARLHKVQPDGRRIFVTPQGQLLCEHGERPSTILSWVAKEARGAREGGEDGQYGGDGVKDDCGDGGKDNEDAPFKNTRSLSLCTCVNTDGMYWTAKTNPKPAELPPMPPSLYSFLEDLNTDKIVVKGRAARHVPHTTGCKAMYLTQKGGLFVCQHAHTLATLRKMAKARKRSDVIAPKFRGGTCNCELDNLPHRCGLKTLPKLSDMPGQFGDAR